MQSVSCVVPPPSQLLCLVTAVEPLHHVVSPLFGEARMTKGIELRKVEIGKQV